MFAKSYKGNDVTTVESWMFMSVPIDFHPQKIEKLCLEEVWLKFWPFDLGFHPILLIQIDLNNFEYIFEILWDGAETHVFDVFFWRSDGQWVSFATIVGYVENHYQYKSPRKFYTYKITIKKKKSPSPSS